MTAFAAASSSAILASRNFARSIEPPLVDEFRRRMHHHVQERRPGGIDDVLVEAGGGLGPAKVRQATQLAGASPPPRGEGFPRPPGPLRAASAPPLAHPA